MQVASHWQEPGGDGGSKYPNPLAIQCQFDHDCAEIRHHISGAVQYPIMNVGNLQKQDIARKTS